jgi:cobalt/nickel transport system ATP-binding protein
LTASVFDEIAFGPRQLNISAEKIMEIVLGTAKKMRITPLLSKPPYRISGGEKKKVAFASAISTNPQVLLIDEPFSELSYDALKVIKDIVIEWKNTGRTVIYTWHDTNIVTELADHIVLMKNGTILSTGAAREILMNEALLTEAGLNLPFTLEIYKRLNGKIDERVPLAIDELAQYLSRK